MENDSGKRGTRAEGKQRRDIQKRRNAGWLQRIQGEPSSTLMAELGDVKMAEASGLAETICPSRGERAVFRRLGNTSSSREMSSASGTRIVCSYY